MSAELEELLVADAAAWRGWLERHHERPGVWLVVARKGFAGPTALGYDAALEVALCFGWIDGRVSRRDAATYRVRFTPRRPRSGWSQSNIAAVERLQAAGAMHPAGLAAVERAKRDGRWGAAAPDGD